MTILNNSLQKMGDRKGGEAPYTISIYAINRIKYKVQLP